MFTDSYPESDPEEIEHSKRIRQMFAQVKELGADVGSHIDVHAGSLLAADDQRNQHYPVSQYAYSQVLVAVGCLEALELMLIQGSGKDQHMVAGPFGPYALMRNAIDAAAIAVWLLEPVHSTLRVKRRIMLDVDEWEKAAALRRSIGEQGWIRWKKKWRSRIKEVAGEADLGSWNPFASKLPPTTLILRRIERHHEDVVMPWLPAWQLASGHAHGKQWAHVASHDLREIADTRTDVGATFFMTPKYGMMAVLLYESLQLLEVARDRYVELAAAPDEAKKQKLRARVRGVIWQLSFAHREPVVSCRVPRRRFFEALDR
jgi:hypothetical protein